MMHTYLDNVVQKSYVKQERNGGGKLNKTY